MIIMVTRLLEHPLERGFKSAKAKSSPFCQLTIESILQKVSVIGIKTLEVEINGSINRDIAHYKHQ